MNKRSFQSNINDDDKIDVRALRNKLSDDLDHILKAAFNGVSESVLPKGTENTDRLVANQVRTWIQALETSADAPQNPAQLGPLYHQLNFDSRDISRLYHRAFALLLDDLSHHCRWKHAHFHTLTQSLNQIMNLSLEETLRDFFQVSYDRAVKDAGNRFADQMLDNNVDLSMSINEVASSNASMMREMGEVDSQTQSISTAVEEMATGIAGISDNTAQVAQQVETANTTAENGSSIIQDTAENMHLVAQAVTEASQRVELLAETSGRIVEMIGIIDDIASQTNLLALNATIEAARAGDAGKGFAVVAGEVKNLSSQTARVTVDVRNTIEALTVEIDGIVQSMNKGAQAVSAGEKSMQDSVDSIDQIRNLISDISRRSVEIAGILKQQEQASVEVSQRVNKIAQETANNVNVIRTSANATDHVVDKVGEQIAVLAKFDVPNKSIRIAKSDHVIWKKRLADMLIGRESLKADELAQHTSCNLGRWYQSEDARSLRNTPAFKQLEEPHKTVHECGIEAVRLYNKGDVEGALALYGKVEKASVEVIRLLDALIKTKTASQ
ncbi:methyl-accepting chemotaxis protein [Thalassospira sp. TSL5-1]|uniref:methyl-accepting chemotaxis protein n=1 Tax=Thalassospira sp. TSL5-1 TaxID=1544451 RepID=UPI00093DEE9B|nr:methyl-accepting chemotaxis protein [Thalassospira sp. TSL5-1]